MHKGVCRYKVHEAWNKHHHTSLAPPKLIDQKFGICVDTWYTMSFFFKMKFEGVFL